MRRNHIRRLARKTALALAILLLLMSMRGVFALYAHGEALGSGRNMAGKINLKTLTVSLDDTVVYDSARKMEAPSVRLAPNSTMSFSLRWEVTGSGVEFRKGDYFSIPVVYVDNLRLTEPFVQALELEAGDGSKTAVAEGRFTYTDNLLAFQVVFNESAANYRIEGGPAGGYAELSLKSGQTALPMTFGDSQGATIEIDTTPGKVLPGIPTFPSTLPEMQKAVFSPGVNGSTVNLSGRYTTMQPGNERKFGLDWRMTFFDLVSHFQSGGGATENVIIEDIAGEGQEFSNFASFATGDRDKGFSEINDEEYEAPFFIEIPIVAVGSNRIYNLHGGDTLPANSPDGYIGTLIRANQLQEISGANVAEQVRRQPLSWGIERLGDGREKLTINLGKLGPGVQKGEGLTADLVKEKDYPYTVLDGVIIEELLTAQYMIETGSADAKQWERVRKESFDTILYYWPGFKDKLCGIAGISPGSSAADLEKALFAMPYERLKQSEITTLGYDERRADGIAGTMRIDSFVLRYRTVLSSVTDSDISNSVKVTTGVLNKEGGADYRHQFYAGIFGTVNAGEIAFIKADAADGYSSGETTEDAVRTIRGLSGAEFEVYETGGGTPLRFEKNGSVYKLQKDGDVTVVRSDTDGAFKITGLSPAKEYTLYEKTAPPGYQLPTDRYTTFRVSSSESKFFVITNREKSTIPAKTYTPGTTDTPGKPGSSDTPDRRVTPNTPDISTPPPGIPKLGDSRDIRLAVVLMLASAMVLLMWMFNFYKKNVSGWMFENYRNKWTQ